MTDKEKIKFWAKGRLFEIMNGIGENDAKNILTDLLSFIDSMQEEPVSEEQVKESLISKHEDKTCKENGNSLTQELVSEELEEVAHQSGYAAYPVDMAEEFGGVIRDNNRYQRSSYIKGFKVGANWQKQKDESKVLTEEQCRKIRDDAFELGKDAMKQQMMKNAVEVPIEEAVPFGSCKWKLCAKLWLDKGVKGNKVKLVIIKEDCI